VWLDNLQDRFADGGIDAQTAEGNAARLASVAQAPPA
jgi:hypothetical protein